MSVTACWGKSHIPNVLINEECRDKAKDPTK